MHSGFWSFQANIMAQHCGSRSLSAARRDKGDSALCYTGPRVSAGYRHLGRAGAPNGNGDRLRPHC
jgi:hypothetical protein